MSKTGSAAREITLARRERRAIIRPTDDMSRAAFVAYGQANGARNVARLLIQQHGWTPDQVERFWARHLRPFSTRPERELAELRAHMVTIYRGLAAPECSTCARFGKGPCVKHSAPGGTR